MEQLDDTALNIYTDGSMYSGPRRGGIGIVFVSVDNAGHEVVDEFPLPGFLGATNQQMELQACIEALKAVRRGVTPYNPAKQRKIVFYTDSAYITDNIYNAQVTWPKTKWTTKGGAPVLNAQQWQELTRMMHRVGTRVDFTWVRGHKTSAHNKAADKLAKRSAKAPSRRTVARVDVRRKRSEAPVQRGSVPMVGQQMTIYLRTAEYLPVQRCSKYKYEVSSRASPHRGKVDIAFSDHVLRAGHSYSVRVNTDANNPQIVKVFREVIKGDTRA